MGGTYSDNVRNTFLREFISMNAMMAGMAPTMSFLMMGRDMRAMQPTNLLFWGVMSLGVVVGFAVAYPVNVWMVKRGLKHGLMTERKSTGGSKHGSGHGSHKMKSDATVPQLAAVASVTTLMLLAGLIVPGFYVNLSLSAHDVGGYIMPPGMIMDFNTPAQTMRDMSAILPHLVSYRAPADARGDQILEPRLENGVKVYELEASVIQWHILPDLAVDAYAFNRQVPGPRLQFTEGDHIRVNFHNNLPESTTVHWHGLIVPNEMDGPAEITQPPIPPGGNYVYEYTVGQSGTYFYHTHDHPDRQQAFGLYGALLIAPRDGKEPRADLEYVVQLQEWLKREWLTSCHAEVAPTLELALGSSTRVVLRRRKSGRACAEIFLNAAKFSVRLYLCSVNLLPTLAIHYALAKACGTHHPCRPSNCSTCPVLCHCQLPYLLRAPVR